jgi:hypothetical protein
VETAVTLAPRNSAALLAAAAMIALLAGLALTGKMPGGADLQRFEPRGIVAAVPSDIRTIEIRLGSERLAFHRQAAGSWAFDGSAAIAVPGELASHLETALRFMHVSSPARILDPADYRGAPFADFGLDPPGYVVSLGGADTSVAVADFGTLNPAQTSQYVRLLGRPTLYLMPRHVGAEWQLVADMAARAVPADAGHHDGIRPRAGLLLPVSIDRVWAVEVVAAGKLHRFERDSAGSWFLHVGQHSHVGDTTGHVADPVQAPVIAAALGAFGESQIEGRAAQSASGSDLERFGLGRPALIALLYARDSSTPLARIEIGATAEDGFSRYTRLAQTGDVVLVAGYEAQRLVDLLKAVGAAP